MSHDPYPPPPSDAPHVPLEPYLPAGTPEHEARAFYERMRLRRTVRMFSDRPVGRETIEWCIRAAGTAPSGANTQPWRFVAISDPAIKRTIREGAEQEEHAFYSQRASKRWLDDLKPFATTPDKRFLEIAPWLIAVFALKHDDDGGQVYYTNESVGIATGLLLAACHHAGLVTVTHTPSPMAFLRSILGRPDQERPYLLIPVGYPVPGAVVPKIERKPIEKIAVWI